jgi:hypothetical protein
VPKELFENSTITTKIVTTNGYIDETGIDEYGDYRIILSESVTGKVSAGINFYINNKLACSGVYTMTVSTLAVAGDVEISEISPYNEYELFYPSRNPGWHTPGYVRLTKCGDPSMWVQTTTPPPPSPINSPYDDACEGEYQKCKGRCENMRKTWKTGRKLGKNSTEYYTECLDKCEKVYEDCETNNMNKNGHSRKSI